MSLTLCHLQGSGITVVSIPSLTFNFCTDMHGVRFRNTNFAELCPIAIIIIVSCAVVQYYVIICQALYIQVLVFESHD